MAQQPVTSPTFQINDIVYITVSAAGRGFLESYRVDGISFAKRTGQWLYEINLAQSPYSGTTLGDRIQNNRERILYFTEAELTDYCTALQLCENYLLNQLASIQNRIAGSDCDTA